MELRFWGVRGSIPSPGPHTLAVGGNTSCLSIECAGHLFIVDAGTGIVGLGQHLEAEERAQIRGSIFLTHYHWDHIQGLPFFMPAFREKNRFSVYGAANSRFSLHDILADQMQPPYFPISIDELDGLVTFNPVKAGDEFRFGDHITVRTSRLNHPNGAIGYRFETPRATVCIVSDHEHPADELDPDVIAFARDADILVHEAPYHPEEKRGEKAGWGHSSWEEATLTAKAANVGRLFLTHHEPERSDPEVFHILAMARRIFPETEVATERTVITVPEPLR